MLLGALLLTAISGGEHELAALVVLGPKIASSPLPRVELLDAAAAALEDDTRLALRSSEQLGLDEAALADCPKASRLGCIVTQVSSRSGAAVVLVASVVPIAERRARVQLTFVDVARARGELGRADAEAVEDAIFAGAIAGEPEVLDPSDRAALARHVRAALAKGRLGADPPPWLERLAELHVAGLAAPAELRVDALAPMLLDPVDPRVRGLRPGRRALRLSGPEGEQQAEIELLPGRTATLAASFVPRPSEDDPRAPMFIGALALAGAGVALAVVSGASAASVTRRCLARPGEAAQASCEGLGWPGFGIDGDALPSLSADRVSGGPPLMIVGAAMLGLGAALGVAEGPLRDRERPLWIDLSIGAAAAIAGAVVAAAAAP